MRSIVVAMITLVVSAPATRAYGQLPSEVAGVYDTKVSTVEGTCPLPVQDNPTEVTAVGGSTILVRHAGTTYQGTLASDSSFTMLPKDLEFDGKRYRITVNGRFPGSGIDARVVLEFGECRVVVRWAGPKRAT